MRLPWTFPFAFLGVAGVGIIYGAVVHGVVPVNRVGIRPLSEYPTSTVVTLLLATAFAACLLHTLWCGVRWIRGRLHEPWPPTSGPS